MPFSFFELNQTEISEFEKYGKLPTNGIWGNATTFGASNVVLFLIKSNKGPTSEYLNFKRYVCENKIKILYVSHKPLGAKVVASNEPNTTKDWIYLPKSEFLKCIDYRDFPQKLDLTSKEIEEIEDIFYDAMEYKISSIFEKELEQLSQLAIPSVKTQPATAIMDPVKESSVKRNITSEEILPYLNMVLNLGSSSLMLTSKNIKACVVKNNKLTIQFNKIEKKDCIFIKDILSQRLTGQPNSSDISAKTSLILSKKIIIKNDAFNSLISNMVDLGLQTSNTNSPDQEKARENVREHVREKVDTTVLKNLSAKWKSEKSSLFIFKAEQEHKQVKINAYDKIITALESNKSIKEAVTENCKDTQTYNALFTHYTCWGNFFDRFKGLRSRDTLKEYGLKQEDVLQLRETVGLKA